MERFILRKIRYAENILGSTYLEKYSMSLYTLIFLFKRKRNWFIWIWKNEIATNNTYF